MNKSRREPPETVELRRRAETRLATRSGEPGRHLQPEDLRLAHELEVQQLELEVQNEELRSARAQIEAGLHRYAELFDFAPIGYCLLGSDGTIQEVNLAAARLVGVDRVGLRGQRFGRFVAARHRALFEQFLTHVLSSPEAGQGESESCELGLAGPTETEVRLTAARLAGTSPAALVAIEDVTARKRAERALREESRHKDDFLAVLSHELRNPLAATQSSLFVLEQALPGGEQARHAQSVILRQIAHLSRIIDDLLDLTRIGRGKILLQQERTDLRELVRRTTEDHRPTFEHAGVQLQASYGTESLWVEADPTRLVQVLANLLGNAVKCTPRGGRVRVALRREGDRAAVSVSDTGVGIDPDTRQRLFVPFSQAPQALDRARGGLGLGLAIAKGLVELHGGTIAAASDGPGTGSEFTVWLPLRAAPAELSPQPARPSHRPSRVLVIDDQPDAAESLRDALELSGHEVQIAYDGPEALDRARAFRPDVAICDIGLPGMDGYQVAQAFRADEALKGTYLVALSGYAFPEDVRRAFEAGFDRHVAKPPSLEALERLFAEASAASRAPIERAA